MDKFFIASEYKDDHELKISKATCLRQRQANIWNPYFIAEIEYSISSVCL